MLRRFLSVAAVMLALASQAPAFELLRVERTCSDSQFLFWAPPAARLDYADLATEYRQQVEQARQRWNASVPSFRFDIGSGNFCDIADAISTLGFSGTDCAGASLDALAVTRLRWNEDSGQLLDADVVFNVNSGLLLDLEIFRQVAMHELGHVLGLDHSDACGDSGVGTLMRSFLDPNDERIESPTADDVNGARFIYGSTGNGGPVPDDANSCAIVPAATGTRPGVVFLLMPLLLAGRWWWGRRS